MGLPFFSPAPLLHTLPVLLATPLEALRQLLDGEYCIPREPRQEPTSDLPPLHGLLVEGRMPLQP